MAGGSGSTLHGPNMVNVAGKEVPEAESNLELRRKISRRTIFATLFAAAALAEGIALLVVHDQQITKTDVNNGSLNCPVREVK